MTVMCTAVCVHGVGVGGGAVRVDDFKVAQVSLGEVRRVWGYVTWRGPGFAGGLLGSW
jgi:hypothetical protein